MDINTRLPLIAILERLMSEGKTIRQIVRSFDQEVSNRRVELYNTGVPEQEIQRQLTHTNIIIDELLFLAFPKSVFSQPPVASMRPPTNKAIPMQPMGMSLPKQTKVQVVETLVEKFVDETAAILISDPVFVARLGAEKDDSQKLDFITTEIDELAELKDDTAELFRHESIYSKAYVNKAALQVMMAVDPTFGLRGWQMLMAARHEVTRLKAKLTVRTNQPPANFVFHSVPGCM